MANLLRSPHESELMIIAEKYIEQREYNLGVKLIHTVALYHYMLIKTNLFLPMPLSYEDYHDEEIKNIYAAQKNC